jgi:hypothetical protein
MIDLVTIYRSNFPIECHILRGRLESDGINCFIFDENFIWINPFWSVGIGGVKLKVPSDQIEFANKIIKSIHQDKLIDGNGAYEISSIFENEIKRQNEILETKFRIRQDPSLLDNPDNLVVTWLDKHETNSLIESEKEFQKFKNIKRDFSWSQFLYELFDFDRNLFKYLRARPVEYYIDKQMVEDFFTKDNSKTNIICPKCNSNNVSYGCALDEKGDYLFLILSLILVQPFPLFRKNHHCFHCGYNY